MIHAGVVPVADDSGLVHWAYYARETYVAVWESGHAGVTSSTLCIRVASRLAPGEQVTCINCAVRYIEDGWPVLDAP